MLLYFLTPLPFHGEAWTSHIESHLPYAILLPSNSNLHSIHFLDWSQPGDRCDRTLPRPFSPIHPRIKTESASVLTRKKVEFIYMIKKDRGVRVLRDLDWRGRQVTLKGLKLKLKRIIDLIGLLALFLGTWIKLNLNERNLTKQSL